ncbi:MAG TPA: DJ-1/PfpI family protein [Isosphaeraceae bacterium]|nr:DJ-1/PfpI family protein [Isosphaeraceae bacterium]
MNGEAHLKGRKIAVLVENLFVPGEIEAYRQGFSDRGAEVHLMSNLWGQEKLTFVSTVDQLEVNLEETRKRLQLLDVSIDFQTVNVHDYAAVIMAASYASVRLRYFQPPPGVAIRPEMARTAPAVKFFAEAMQDPHIVKGALCHALWLLTPTPELLAGRKVICNEVVLADVLNAGAIYTPSPDDVVVDQDLVTGRTWHQVDRFIEAISEQIGSVAVASSL